RPACPPSTEKRGILHKSLVLNELVQSCFYRRMGGIEFPWSRGCWAPFGFGDHTLCLSISYSCSRSGWPVIKSGNGPLSSDGPGLRGGRRHVCGGNQHEIGRDGRPGGRLVFGDIPI